MRCIIKASGFKGALALNQTLEVNTFRAGLIGNHGMPPHMLAGLLDSHNKQINNLVIHLNLGNLKRQSLYIRLYPDFTRLRGE